MSFKAGDWIKHPKFGDGLVLAHEEPYFVVRFVTDGEKRLQAAFVKEAGVPPTPDFRFPEAARVSKRATAGSSRPKKPAHSFVHFVERFLALYPDGFDDAGFVRDERDYKLAAIEKLKENLSLTEIDSLLASKDFAEACRRAKQVGFFIESHLSPRDDEPERFSKRPRRSARVRPVATRRSLLGFAERRAFRALPRCSGKDRVSKMDDSDVLSVLGELGDGHVYEADGFASNG